MVHARHDYFITGTDTEIGKTFITCVLLHTLRAQGIPAVGMKPVAAGAQSQHGQLRNEDVLQLQAASEPCDVHLANPYLFPEPIAPHIAASHAGVEIEEGVITRCFAALQSQHQAVLVEGVGGFRVPLGAHFDTALMAQALRLPVILVVGMRLGCINHALLTAEAIVARGMPFAGWVANQIDPQMACFAENLAALTERLPAPLLGVVEHIKNGDPTQAVGRLVLPVVSGRA